MLVFTDFSEFKLGITLPILAIISNLVLFSSLYVIS
nr:MAG TPA: hypothetical protein [Bacteriophage sp.]